MSTRKPDSTPHSAFRNPHSAIRWWQFGAAAAIALLLYVPTLWYGFVWDDTDLIVENEFLVRTNPFEIFARGFWSNPTYESVELTYYRPLSTLTYYFDRTQWQLNPAGFHATNVFLHALVVFLLCLLLYELFHSSLTAALGGLLLGVHPAVNSAPTWIAARNYLLALLFLLAAFYCLYCGRDGRSSSVIHRPSSGPGRRTTDDARRMSWWLAGYGAAFLLATLSIEGALAFFPLALGWLILRRKDYSGWGQWLGITLVVPLVYLIMRLGLAHTPFPPSAFGKLLEHPLSLVNVFGQQLLFLFVPWGQKLIYTLTPALAGFSGYTVVGLLFLVVPLLLVVRTRSRLGALGYAWMVLLLLPFGSLMTMGASGRTLYLAVPGVIIMVLALLKHVKAPSRGLVMAGWVIAGVVASAFAVQTLRRNPIWKDETTLYTAGAREAPESTVGQAYIGDSLMTAGDAEAAIVYFRRAVELSPDYLPVRTLLARALLKVNDPQGAIEHLRVVAVEDGTADAENNLALTMKQAGLLDSAVVHYRRALEKAPNSEMLHNNLGSALIAQGDYPAAIAAFKTALRLKPDFAAARENLLKAGQEAGRSESAARDKGRAR